MNIHGCNVKIITDIFCFKHLPVEISMWATAAIVNNKRPNWSCSRQTSPFTVYTPYSQWCTFCFRYCTSILYTPPWKIENKVKSRPYFVFIFFLLMKMKIFINWHSPFPIIIYTFFLLIPLILICNFALYKMKTLYSLRPKKLYTFFFLVCSTSYAYSWKENITQY